MAWQPKFNNQSASFSCCDSQRPVVGFGDAVGDGKPQAVAFAVGGSPCQSDKGFNQGINDALRNISSGVLYSELDQILLQPNENIDLAVRYVVPHGVLQEIVDGLAQKRWVPEHAIWLLRFIAWAVVGDPNPQTACLAIAGGDALVDQGANVDGLAGDISLIDVGQGKQRLHGLDVLPVHVMDALCQDAKPLGINVRVGKGNIDHRLGRCKGCAEFV